MTPKMIFLTAFLLLAAVFATAAEPATITSHDDRRDTPRFMLGDIDQPDPAFSPEETVVNYLRRNASLFRLSPDLAGLELVQAQDSLLGRHFLYRQTIDGIPVVNATLAVSVSWRDRRVSMVHNNTYPADTPPARPRLALSGEDALDAAWNHLRVHGELLELPTSELVYVPEGSSFRLAWRTQVSTAAPHGYWEHLVDAATGDVIGFRATEVDGRLDGDRRSDAFEDYFGPVDSRAVRTTQFLRSQASRAETKSAPTSTVNGMANVFCPDPKTTILSDALSDSSPADAFTAAYAVRTLRDISFDGTTYRLNGPWVTIANFEGPFSAPSTTTDGQWLYQRGSNGFCDAMVYYHIDQNQRYVQSLGFTNVQYRSIPVDSNGCSGADNSYFLPSTNKIAYGHGGVPDPEDADVILHEYWHALQYSINPAWVSGDTGAMGEGFGDYWAGSYGYSEASGPVFHPDWAFQWDGHNEYWKGRAHDKTWAQYSSSFTYDDHVEVNGVYSDELWGTPIWQAFRTLADVYGRPRSEMDAIILQANFGFGSSVRMPEMAGAIVATAQALFPTGPHAAVFRQKFFQNNIFKPVKAGGCELVSESGSPANGYPDPGETVTIQFTVQNPTDSATTDLVGSLLATGIVASPSSPQSFGAIPAGGSATRAFTFTVSPSLSCGANVPVTLSLADGGTLYPDAVWVLPTGSEEVLSEENFDTATPPAVPAGWSTAAATGIAKWATTRAIFHSAPNSVYIKGSSIGTDTRLTTAAFSVPSADCLLTFFQLYNFESDFDGGILEISIDSGDFTDILAAGGSFIDGGYNGTINTYARDNPLAGRNAWVDSAPSFRRTVVALPPTAAGKPVAFRFRAGYDAGTSSWGWHLDDIRLSRLSCVNPVVPGDVNGDGVVSEADYEDLSGWLAQAEGSYIQAAAADLNADGAIDTQDLVLLARMLLSL